MEYYANSKNIEFTSPLPEGDILKGISHNDPIIDFGCGYGRVLKYLADSGYTNLMGIDCSENLINRATVENPIADYLNTEILAFNPDKKFKLGLLCGVLEYFVDQRSRLDLVSTTSNCLLDSGKLLVETFLLDENNLEEYTKFQKQGHPLGTIVLSNGLKLYHQSQEQIDDLFSSKFYKTKGELKLFNTWKGIIVPGYIANYTKRGT